MAEGIHAVISLVLGCGHAGGGYQPQRFGCPLRAAVDHGPAHVGGPAGRLWCGEYSGTGCGATEK